MSPSPPSAIDPRVRIGHVHLKVSGLERALDFYCGVLGFHLKQRFGSEAAFIAAGDYHHHIGLNTWHSAGAAPAAAGSVGLRSFTVELPDQRALAGVLDRLDAAGIPVQRQTGGVFVRDPFGTGVLLSSPGDQ